MARTTRGLLTVLVCHRDTRFRDALADRLGPRGFAVLQAADPAAALHLLDTVLADAVLLACETGWEAVSDRLAQPPFDGRTLVATVGGPEPLARLLLAPARRTPGRLSPAAQRLLQRLRRTLREAADATPGADAPFAVGPWRFEPETRELVWRDAEEMRRVQLGPIPYRIASLIARAEDRVLSRQEIAQAIWGVPGGSPRTVDVYVFRLRRALAESSLPPFFEPVRGAGWRRSAQAGGGAAAS